jgi:hypothetical protein
MKPYADINGDSGVVAYDYGDDWIIVEFGKGGKYKYDYNKPGAHDVEEMKRLADTGDGLNAYININVRSNYAAKL